MVDSDLERNRGLWNEKKVTNYNLVVRFESSGFSTPASPVKIVVRNSEPVSVKAISKDDKRPLNRYTYFYKVEKMFDVIQRDLEGNGDVEVVFNSEFGYPESLNINYARNGPLSFYQLHVDKFEIINPLKMVLAQCKIRYNKELGCPV
jgi:hypothetical protein